MGEQQRISYVPLEDMTPDMRAEMERCAREGTPRPESSAIRAHVPAAFWFFANAWNDLFRGRQKAALAYAEAIAWHLETDDAFWSRMNEHFDEPELVELGCMIGLTLGQQSWLRLLNIEHHEVMAGSDASMAPGFETAEELERSKAAEGYWAGR